MYRILIVDNSPIIRSGLTKMTERLSDEALVSGTVANGVQALDWLADRYADLCMTDIRMPVMDGLALIGEINRRYPGMPSIIVSSYDEFSYAKQGMALGAVDYLLKPVKPEDLGRVLDKTLTHIRHSRQHAAKELLLQHLIAHKPLMDRWVEQIRYNQFESMPLLVVDTLELLEQWVESSYHLLHPLAMEWLRLVAGELRESRAPLELPEGDDLGLGERVIARDKVRAYFRLGCVRRLEDGAGHLFAALQGKRDNQTRSMMSRIKDYLHARHAEKSLNLQQVADHVGFSKNYMSHLFKQETGTTVWSYLVGIRMQSARDMLLHSNLKLYEIADRLGYEDAVYFSRLFKEHYGMTPIELKKRMEM
ncbi:response regulator [Paenibacillus sp. IB182496]|uniref:Response regulator n=1 Tax=Paenibacillus sabuli TaxID=2772509 RepID=A0A927GPY5_9BACL|nr:response regulator [Paenibacillus sabuli]MBD2843959.1 response regulator [Paenibacillus sabuli]